MTTYIWFTLFLLLIYRSLSELQEIIPSGVSDYGRRIPLITIDPYISIWSFKINLYEENVGI